MTRSFTIVRCPDCGSTEAGEDPDGGHYELTLMVCPTCGARRLCDHYEIKDSWNVTITVADDVDGLPPRVAPDLGDTCDACRRGAPDSLQPLASLARVERCTACRICYARNGEELLALHRVTSTFLRALARDEAPHPATLSSLAACSGFDAARVMDALAPQTPLAPLIAWLQGDLAAERRIPWPLLVAVVRAGADASALVPELARVLERETAREPARGAARDTAEDTAFASVLVRHATAVLDELAARGVDVGAARVPALRALESDADLFVARPHLARACA